MKIEYFREFLVLTDCLNFSVASEQLYIAQPVLSRHIALIEKEFNTHLFSRNTKNVSLTKAGEIFKESAYKIVKEYDELKMNMDIISEGFDGTLTIGVPYFALISYLGDIPHVFEEKYPKIKLSYEVGSPNRIMKAIESRRVDLGVVPNLNYPSVYNLTYIKLFEEALGVLVSEDDPIAKNIIKVSDLNGRKIFRIGGTYFSSSWERLKSLCNEEGFEPQGVDVPLMESALVSAKSGGGIIVAGEHMKHQAGNGLVYVPLDGERCKRDISVCFIQDRKNDVNIQRFIDIFNKQ